MFRLRQLVQRHKKLFTASVRGMSANNFSGEVTELYTILSKQHTHENGPWNKMIAAASAGLPGGKGTVLDVASGPGEPGLSIAKILPDAVVIVTDVSQDQLDVATRRCVEAGVSNVKFALSNAEDLSQFASASMDVVTCCYGFMFCEDKQRAVAEAYRVLKPGGRLVSTCWKTLVGVELSKATMTAALNGTVPPPPPINPMSLSAPGAFQELLVGAGFRAEDISSSESTYPFVFQGDKERLFKMGSIPIMPKLEEMRQEGKLAEVEAGKAAFWAQVEKLSSGSAPRVTVVSPEELHVLDNRFELTVSTKQA